MTLLEVVKRAQHVLGEAADNEQNLEMLFDRAPKVVPFVGAGLSVDYGYPQWGDLLRNVATSDLLPEVEGFLDRGLFGEAAERIMANSPYRFEDRLRSIFDARKLPEALGKGAVRLLPSLAP